MTTRSIYERINAGEIAAFGESLADDFVEHESNTGFPPTKEGTLDYFQALMAAFPDMHMNIDDLIASEDKVVVRVTATATHKGEFMGMAPTGKHMKMQLIDIMRYDDAGMLREHWGVADMLSLMQQLGTAPAGPPA